MFIYVFYTTWDNHILTLFTNYYETCFDFVGNEEIYVLFVGNEETYVLSMTGLNF